MTSHKDAIVRQLKLLKQEELANKQFFKARAYGKALEQIHAYEGDIKSVNDIKDLPGMGKSIVQKIEEIIQTGELERTKGSIQKMDAIEKLSEVMAIGPVKAKELVEKHSITSVEELKEKGLHLLNEKQKLGVKYHDDFSLRIPRKEMLRHESLLKDSVEKISKGLAVELMGSFRRGLSSSGDIDVLVTYDANAIKEDPQELFKSFIHSLKEAKYLHEDFAYGPKKYNGTAKLPRFKHYRRIDLMLTQPAQVPFALLYFTGSQKFNIAMRNVALSKGMTLNEYGLRFLSTNEPVTHTFETEEDVFQYLGLQYVPPVNREHTQNIPKLH